MPWIPDDKTIEKQYMEAITRSNADILFGHFSLNGFYMQKGRSYDGGIDHKKFSKFQIVGSGHFHHRSTKDNVWYFGAPYQMDWSDHGNTKGFHILDTSTMTIEFIPNSHDVYHVIDYDEANIPDISKIPVDGSFLKINVVNKEHQTKFDAFMTLLEGRNPFKVDVIDKNDFDIDDQEVEIVDTKDTPTIIADFIDALEIDLTQRSDLKVLFNDLYKEAISSR